MVDPTPDAGAGEGRRGIVTRYFTLPRHTDSLGWSITDGRVYYASKHQGTVSWIPSRHSIIDIERYLKGNIVVEVTHIRVEEGL